ncbi:MAG TPA: asparagine synthase (glutamine-hydrolyzing) [Rhizomicrobium sp.]
MCGITGFLDPRKRLDAASSRALVLDMARAIAHRGPDGDGAFVEAECGLAFGHRRLSIIDLSQAGAQPMVSADGRWVISFNGEIYNFEEIRRRLEDGGAIAWRGHSDTEVLVEAIARRGFEATLNLANGMFAISAWDRRERALYLARDRMGEKPLYYGWQGETFLFGSELKALARHPDFSRRLDPAAVSLFVAYGYVPSPFSIYRGLSQLRPGHYLRLAADAPPGAPLNAVPYWTLPLPAPQVMDEHEAEGELDRLLADAVRLRMRADVPMGAFLSGGIDSSAVVGLMQAQSNVPVRSYSIGFAENAYDEAPFAREVARHLGTEHTEIYVEPRDALDVIPSLPQLYDEPFGDSSQVPTFLLCKLTRAHVTVSLSGDGGDELFGGYGRYFGFESRWASRVRGMDALRAPSACLLRGMPAEIWSMLRGVAPPALRNKLHANRARYIASAIGARTKQEFYAFQMQSWPTGMLDSPEADHGAIFFGQHALDSFAEPFLGMMYLDAGSYLPDDILVKVDRAAMAVSLESRVPMLDHRVVEFASRVPLNLKRRGDAGKWLLRRVLDRYVPQNLIDRPKQGFGLPVKEWLRGPLKAWGDELLNDETTVIGELVDLSRVRDVWREHQHGIDHSYRLWVIIVLVAWAREWRPL